MKLKMFIPYIIFVFFVGCGTNQRESKIISNDLKMDINIDSIGYIEINMPDKSYLIQSQDSIGLIINAINTSNIEYIKFGSPNKFIIYNKQNEVLEKGFFRDSTFKINGVVFRANKKIFD